MHLATPVEWVVEVQGVGHGGVDQLNVAVRWQALPAQQLQPQPLIEYHPDLFMEMVAGLLATDSSSRTGGGYSNPLNPFRIDRQGRRW